MDEESIFAAAIAIQLATARAAFVDEACGGDEQLQKRVEALIYSHEMAGSFLDKPAAPCSPTIDQPPLERPGTHVGPYKLLSKLGEGGMGGVFLAEQKEPVERQVALKVIRPGMDSRRVLDRFEGERQALAMMDHPSIAKVLDAGATGTGRPYFVMELVQGEPITRYCDARQLSVRERLKLFISVCQAVQHAHQKGIIHRDIKPSNILVAEYDGQAVPKVIDFGVAKAVDHQLTQKHLSTQYGQIVGTLEYMSPEQARLNPNDVDTRSDIYSLGTVLYELLSGSTPFERERLYSTAFDQALHIIESEEPIKPSMRLSSSDALPSVAVMRHVEPQRLTSTVRGELDWIVMKALEKDRARRYDSATGLAQDIENYLENRPVLAGPPSPAYRFRKFVRRNKSVLATAAIVALALIVGTSVATWQAVRAHESAQLARREAASAKYEKDQAERAGARAERAAEKAEDEAAISQAVVGFLTNDLLAQADPENELDRDIKLRTVLDRASANLDGRFADQPLVEAAIHMTLGRTFHSLGEFREAKRHLETAREIRCKTLGPEDPDTLQSMIGIGSVLLAERRDEEAGGLFNQVLEIARRTLSSEHTVTLRSMNALGILCKRQRRFDEAEALYTRVIEGSRKALGPEHLQTLTTMHNLATLYEHQRRFDEAEALYTRVIEGCRKALGPEHPLTLATMHNLATLYSYHGRKQEAEALFKSLLETEKRVLGANHPDTIRSQTNLALMYGELGRFAESTELYTDALETQRRILGSEHPVTAVTMNNLALIYRYQGRWDEAEKLFTEAVTISRSTLGLEHPTARLFLKNLVRMYNDRRRYRQAAGVYRNRLKDFLKLSPDKQDIGADLARCANNLTWSLTMDWQQDLTWSKELVLLATEALRLSPERSEIWVMLGAAQYRLGDIESAVQTLSRSIELGADENGIVLFLLAMAQWRLGHYDESRDWYEKAVAWSWNNSASSALVQLGSEAAKLLRTRSPPLSFVLPLPRTPLFGHRPFFGGEHLASLLDAQPPPDPEQLADQKRMLASYQSSLRIVDPTWELSRIVVFPKAISAHFNPQDGRLYVGRRMAGVSQVDRVNIGFADGIYSIDANGDTQEVVATTNIAGVAVDHRTGDVYYSEDVRGRIARVAFGDTEREVWVAETSSEKTFPVGLAIADTPNVGPLLTLRQAVVAHHGGNHRRDEISRFSTDRPYEQVVIYQDAPHTGPLVTPLDVALAGKEVFLADRGTGIFRLRADGSVEPFETSEPLHPTGIAVDPITGDLLVVDGGKRRLIAVDAANGAVTNILEGLVCDYWGGAGIDITPDGKHLFYTEHDTGQIVTLSRKSGEPSCYERGLDRANNNEWAEAVKLFTKMTEQDPQHALAFCARGFAYAKLDQFEKAKSDWDAAVEIDPAIALHFYYRGEVLREENQLQRAVDEYNKALQLNPTLARGYASLASTYLMQSDIDEAIRNANRAIELDPTNGLYYADRGLAFESQGNVAKAKSDGATAVQLNGNCASHYLKRGVTLGNGSNWALAATAFGRAIQLDPRNHRLYLQRAEAWTWCQQWAKAEQDLLKTIEIDAPDIWTWFRLGMVRLAAGDEEAYRHGCHDLLMRHASGDNSVLVPWQVVWCCRLAPIGDDDIQRTVRLARESLAESPGNHRIRHELACILYRAGAFQESARLQQDVWEKMPRLRPWSGIWLSMAHAQMGNEAEARTYLQLAVAARKNADLDVYQLIEYRLLRSEAARQLANSAEVEPLVPHPKRQPKVKGALTQQDAADTEDAARNSAAKQPSGEGNGGS